MALDDGGAGPPLADGLQRVGQGGFGAGIDAEHVVAALGAHDPMVVDVAVVTDAADLARAHCIADGAAHLGQGGGQCLPVGEVRVIGRGVGGSVVRLGVGHVPLPTMRRWPASA